MLPIDPAVPSYQEVEDRAQKGQEYDDQYPHDLIVALKLTGEYGNQCHEREQDNKEDHEQGDQQASAEKKQEIHLLQEFTINSH